MSDDLERELLSILERGHKRGLALLAAVVMNDDVGSAFAADRLRAERVCAASVRERHPSIAHETLHRVLEAFDVYNSLLDRAPSISEFAGWERLLRWRRIRGSDYNATVEMPDLFEVEAREMTMIPLQVCGLYVLDCSFVVSSLVRTSFDDALVERCDFSRSGLAHTSWRRATIVDCSFAGADMAGSCFDEATFIDCDLRGADLSAASRGERSSARATFLDSDLRETKWSRRVLENTTFERWRMFGLHGRPVVRGVRIEAPETCPLDHERTLGDPEQVLRMWKHERQAN